MMTHTCSQPQPGRRQQPPMYRHRPRWVNVFQGRPGVRVMRWCFVVVVGCGGLDCVDTAVIGRLLLLAMCAGLNRIAIAVTVSDVGVWR